MIIGISGKSGSGKDYVYENAILKNMAAVKMSFAKILKEAAALIIGVDSQWFDDRDFKETKLENFDMTGREFLQKMGAGLRNLVDTDIWVKAAMASCTNHEIVNYVFTDVRYPNEVKAIEDKGGIVIRLERLLPYNEWARLHGFVINPHEVDDDTLYDKDEFIAMALVMGESVHSLLAESEVALDEYKFEHKIVQTPNNWDEVVEKILEITRVYEL